MTYLRKVTVAIVVVALMVGAGVLWVPLLLGGLSSSFTEGPAPTSSPVERQRETWPGGSSPDRQTGLSSEAKPNGFVDPPAGEGIQRYLAQQIGWRACGDYECAEIRVPLDWGSPDEQAITVSMLRVRAKNSSKGPLFTNPGGPGIPGRPYATLPALADSFPEYDIIGWDTRGSGQSTPVQCGTVAETDAYVQMDHSPEDDAEYQALVEANKAFARQCREKSGALLDHVSTLETVRDLDLMRALLGAERLNYFGVSYGTYIGAVYAEFFPDRVGRLILDAAVNITKEDQVPQAVGFDKAFEAFLAWCVNQGNCALGSTVETARQAVKGFVDGLDTQPLKVGDRMLTQTLASKGIGLSLYEDKGGYEKLLETLSSAMNGDGKEMLKAADVMEARNREGGYHPVAYAFPAIACLDNADEGLSAARTQWERDRTKAPLWGHWFGPSGICEVWTAKPVPQYKLTGAGAAPIMVIGGTGDSATPYQHSVDMAKQLESGFLITLEGPGHGSVTSGNQCIIQAVRDYLADGKPQEGKTCR